MVNIGNSWDEVLKGEFEKDYYLKLREFLKAEYGSRVIYPDMYDIFNALKFTPAGGRVTVSLRFERKQVLLAVTDTGGGIPVERMETVFDGYLHPERLAALPCGLGLGLPLCRRIAEGHGGRMVLDSRPDQGTSVTLALPDEMAADTVEDVQFDYAGGFQPALVGLADALPYQAFLQKHSDD